MNLKICTLNLWGFNEWRTRQEAIAKHLKEVDADIVCFQEVVFDPDTSTYTQVGILNNALDYKYEHIDVSRLYSGSEIKNFREGLAILSQHPVVRAETLALRKNEDDKHVRIVQLLDIQVDNRMLLLANVHFSNQADFSRTHLKELLEILSNRYEKRIVVGDFNMNNNIDKNRDLFEENYILSTDFASYTSYPGKSETLDYIMLPKNYSFNSINTSTEYLSDHKAVTAEISI